jgi:predicted ATP-grasp superfamily ATP-dependent carboligase
MVEFKYDEKSNKGWFIEINPRLWGSIYLAIASGVEFPYLTYLCAIGQEAKAKRIAVESPIRQGTIARWYLGDLIIFAHRMLNREFAHSLSLLLPGNENSYDDVFTDDLQAFVGEMMFYLERFMKTHSFNPTEGANIG